MKKILAFVLATIMVLSLVPASAFAAFTKCPATHTSTNCDCKLVQTVTADCETVGYQVYVCNDCGESFVDNYVQKLPHTWVADEELAAGDIKASCIYQRDGVAYVECAVCELKEVKNTKWNSTDVHNVYHVSGVGCEKLYACSICNAQGYLAVDEDGDTVLSDEAAHNYTFTKVEVEPKWENGTSSIGKALFTCTDIVDDDGKVIFEGCGSVKQVDIENPDCNKHGKEFWDKFVLVQAAVAPTCTADGYYLVVKCPDCGKLFYDKDADNDPKTKNYEVLKDGSDSGTGISKADAKIGKLGHSPVPTGVTCQGTYKCTRCDVAVTGNHAYGAETVVSSRNCLVQGYKYQVCTICGYIKTTTQAAQGHDTAKQFISATCAVQGGYYEYCKRSNCPLAKTTIIDQLTKEAYTLPFTGAVTYIGVNPDGHKLVETPVTNITTSDMYCTQAGYTIVTCENNCAEYAGGKIVLKNAVEHTKYIYSQQHNYTKATTVGTDVFHAYTTRTVYKCAKCDWSSGNVDVIDTTIKNTFSSVEEALVYHGMATAFYTYNKKKTQVLDHYEGRDGLTLDAAKAKFLPQGATAGSCTVDAIATFFCTDCGNYVYINYGKTPHTEGKKTEGYPSTCTKPGLRDTYVCTDCGVTFWYDADNKQQTGSPVINPCAGNADSTLIEKTDCSDAGTKYYECSKCKTAYTKKDCATKYVEAGHKYTVLLAGQAATCNAAGLPEIRYCSVCKELEINAIYEVAGKEVRLNYNAAGTKYKAGDVVVTLGKAQHFSADAVTVKVAASGTVSYTYLTITQYAWPSDVTVIKMEAIAKNVANKNEHWAPYVADELASGVVPAATVTWKKSVKQSTQTDTTVDHTKPYFKLNYCEACEYEFISNYSAATGGHVNSKGSILTTDCENEGVPGDRICVVCGQEIVVAHTWSEEKGNSTATCIKTGVVYKYCVECGHYDFVTDDITLPNAKEFHDKLIKGTHPDYKAEVVGTVLDYAHNGASYLACPECGVALSEYEEEEMKASGLEIYLTTDAESYIPGSKVYVTVSLDSLNGVNVWGLNFPVSFDPEVFKFNGYKFNTAESAFQTFAVNEVAGGYEWSTEYPPCALYGMLSTGKKGPSGVVSIVANADANVLVKGSQDLVVLEFVIISAEASTEQFRVGDASVLDIKLGQKLKEIDPEIVSTYAELYTVVRGSQSYRNYSVEVINANGRAVDVLKNDENYSNEIEITGFLNLDGEEGISMADAYALYSLIYNNEYDVKADADFDGYVTAKDLSILYAILTGVVTVEQLVTPDAELPEGWEAWMGAK